MTQAKASWAMLTPFFSASFCTLQQISRKNNLHGKQDQDVRFNDFLGTLVIAITFDHSIDQV